MASIFDMAHEDMRNTYVLNLEDIRQPGLYVDTLQYCFVCNRLYEVRENDTNHVCEPCALTGYMP